MSIRVTNSMFTDQFRNEINSSLTLQANIQNQISSGLAFTQPSDSPLSFSLLKQQETSQTETNGYLTATSEASNEATTNSNAMSSLQNVMTQAGSLATQGVNTTLGSEGLIALGTEMATLVDQVQSIANQNENGYYSFGGTQNQPPVNASTPPGYNTGVVTNNNLKSIQIAANSNPVNVQIFSGSVDYTNAAYAAFGPTQSAAPEGGAPPSTVLAQTFATTAVLPATATNGSSMAGFLVKAGITDPNAITAAGGNPADPNAGGVDILGFLRNAAYTLSQGQALSTAQLQNITRASNYISEYVGQTTATLAQFGLNQQSLNTLKTSNEVQISTLSSANLAALSTDLSSAQVSYQGALDSGAKILQMSLLDYLH